MNVGGYQGVRAQAGLRAAVNAQLEEISFRTGLIAAAITLVALLAIAAAAVYAATVSHSGPASSTASVRNVASVPAVPPTAPAPAMSVPPSAPAHPAASPKAKTQPTVPAAAVPAPATAAPPPQTQAGSAGHASRQLRSQDNGRTSRHAFGPWFGGHAPRHGGFGFPAPFGRGPWH